MADEASAANAIASLRGVQLNGRTMDIVADSARRGGRPPRR